MSELQFFQSFVESARDRNHHREFRPVRWIEVEEKIIRLIDRIGATRPGIVIDAAKPSQKEQGSKVVRRRVMDFLAFPFRIDGHRLKPVWQPFAHIFLKKRLALDSVGITPQHQSAVAQKGKNQIGDLIVVSEQIAFRVARFGKINFVQVCQPQPFAVQFDRDRFRASFEQLFLDLRFLADHFANDGGGVNDRRISRGRCGLRCCNFVLPCAVLGPNVFAQRDKNRVTQSFLLRPFAKLHSRDERRRNPVRLLIRFGHCIERTRGSFQLLKFPAQLLQFFSVEAGADVSDESQLFAFIEAEKQRAKRNSRCAGFAPAADDGVDRLRHFELEPAQASL